MSTDIAALELLRRKTNPSAPLALFACFLLWPASVMFPLRREHEISGARVELLRLCSAVARFARRGGIAVVFASFARCRPHSCFHAPSRSQNSARSKTSEPMSSLNFVQARSTTARRGSVQRLLDHLNKQMIRQIDCKRVKKAAI